MRKIKLSSGEIRIIIFIAAIVILALAYFLGFTKLQAKADVIKEQNEIDQATVDNLQAMVLRESEVRQNTADCYAAIDEIIEKYPSDVTTEKAIAIIQDIENETAIHISDISFLMDDLMGDVLTGDAGAINTAYYASLTMNYVVDYEGFKNMVDYVSALKDRTTIPVISAAYDPETGEISGVVNYYMYYLTNTGKEYEAPEIDGIEKGVEDIFSSGSTGSSNASLNEDGEDGSSDDETEEEDDNSADTGDEE